MHYDAENKKMVMTIRDRIIDCGIIVVLLGLLWVANTLFRSGHQVLGWVAVAPTLLYGALNLYAWYFGRQFQKALSRLQPPGE